MKETESESSLSPFGGFETPASYQADNMTDEEAEAGIQECARTFRYPSPVEAEPLSKPEAKAPPPPDAVQLPGYDDGDDPVAFLLATSCDSNGNRRSDPPKVRNVGKRRKETKRQLKRRLADEAAARIAAR